MNFNYVLYITFAIAPALAIIIFVYWRDKFGREPLRMLIASFYSGCVSVLPALAIQIVAEKLGWFSDGNAIDTAIKTYILIAISEEGTKFNSLMNYYKHKEFNEPYDGITYSVMVSMGFATVENLIYIFRSFHPLDTAIMRMFTAVPAHATFAVMMGYFVGLARFSNKNKFLKLLLGLIVAVFMHGTYDFFIYMNYEWGTWYGAIAALIAGIFFSLRAIKIHRNRISEMENVL